mmetsp:Transcript_7612/g.16309  ORF Transcript_7612/g.16309 Transcript_7612/m.16309 type:complete len:266 (-) Transcript_7612:310-1107(-)
MAATINAENRRKANLRSLQRIDSNIVDLAITATHVVLYEFDNSKRTWERKNVEGSLFVAKRSDAPRFKLVVLNRSSTENLEVPITASFQMQVNDPYMMFRDSAASKGGSEEKIRGIWFHDSNERGSVVSYLENVVKSLAKIEEMEKAQPPPTQSSQKTEAPSPTDAGAALLATLNLGAKNNNQSTQHQKSESSQERQDDQKQSARNSSAASHNLVLDKKSLQLSLLSLIQDERFLDLIHAQYLKVVHSRAARQQSNQNGNSSGKK